MSRNSFGYDYCLDDDSDSKIKFKSLISVTVSTIMCLAAKCPLPRSNVETTKLFLNTVTDENGETPRNIKSILKILSNYKGPYDTDLCKSKAFEKPPAETPTLELAQLRSLPSEEDTRTLIYPREITTLTETQLIVKRSPKNLYKRPEKEKSIRAIPRSVTSKSILSKPQL